MTVIDEPSLREKVELHGMLAEFRGALEEEIAAIKKYGLAPIELLAGVLVSRRFEEWLYRFKVEYMPVLPADTPCKLIVGRAQYDVIVISFDEHSVTVVSKIPLEGPLGSARLEIGTTILLELLIKCIEKNAGNPNPAGDRMLPSEGKKGYFQKLSRCTDFEFDEGDTERQKQAIVSALENNITYIWGPPGTGKTTVIAKIVGALYKQERSVLVVSHTNVAVDGVIRKVDESYFASHREDKGNYPILRIGSPATVLPERVFLETHIRILGEELYEREQALERRRVVLQQRIDEIRPQLAKDRWIKENALAQLGELIKRISECESEVSSLQRAVDAIAAAVEQEKAAHPEYGEYGALTKVLGMRKKEYSEVCGLLETNKKALEIIPQKIQEACDEIKKHNKYAELKKKQSESMSESFLRERRGRAIDAIRALELKIDELEHIRTQAIQTIDAYKRLSPIKKLFSLKKALHQAQQDLETVRTALPQIEEDLRSQQRLKSKYAQQLEDLLLLEKQMADMLPSKTKAYWESTVQSLEFQLVAARNAQPGLLEQEKQLSAQIDGLEQKWAQAKRSFDILQVKENELKLAQQRLEESNAALLQKREQSAALFKREQSFYSEFFYVPMAADEHALLDELNRLKEAVIEELRGVDIAALQQEKERVAGELSEVFRQLNEIAQEKQELEKRAIMSAKIVGATLAKTYLSETLRGRSFDTVILDEASMAPIPALWCASCLASANIVIVGDFLQLPPIVMSKKDLAKKWLGKDIFYHSGMQECAKSGRVRPENFIMLRDQFRMESDIADIANMYYGEYGGLYSHDQTPDRVNMREAFYQWYSGKKTEQNIHLIDTEHLHAWATGVPQGKRHSRLNCFSSVVDVDLAFKFLENKLNDLDPVGAEPVEHPHVLIIAPYKPHIIRINQLIDFEYRRRGFKEDLNYVKGGTIHSFQGSEAEIVIFDLVVDQPHRRANLFMPDREINEGLRRMFNVAVTRAKFKLYIVGNFAFCRRMARGNALAEFLDHLTVKKRLAKVDAKELFPKITFSRETDFSAVGRLKGAHIVCRETSFSDYFLADIHSFKKRMIIYSPFITINRLEKLLPAFADAINAGKQLVVVTKTMAERQKKELAAYQQCENQLRNMGIAVLHKKAMHEKLVFVDEDAVWIGSLNVLSFTGLTSEIMQRHADAKLVRSYKELFNVANICSAIENNYELKCPVCKGEMILRESGEGGVYWSCAGCGYSRKTDQAYPRDGVLCCASCGAPYVFSMKKEPRWVCTANSKHFQKVRPSDLRLEKMAALIRTKLDWKRVEGYFASQEKRKGPQGQPSRGTTKQDDRLYLLHL